MEIDSLDYDAGYQNFFYNLGEHPIAIQKAISDDFASSSLSAALGKKEMLLACQKANPHFSVQPNATALQKAALEEKKLVVIAKVEMKRRPIPGYNEDEFIDYYDLTYPSGCEYYFSVFVTLDDGTRYFMPELWVDTKDTSHIPSFLAKGKTFEIVSLPESYKYQNFPRVAFRDIETGQTSNFFIKYKIL